jgi:glycine cleavage system H protein
MSRLLYSKSHLWVKYEGQTATVGITSYALKKLGHVMFWSLPDIGDEVEAGTAFGDIEGVKKVSDLIAPVSGKIAEVNDGLIDEPDKINNAPFEAWLVKIETDGSYDGLMDEAEYKEYIKTL